MDRGRRLYEGSADEALARLVDIAIQIAWGLQHAHHRGLVHQDVKPDNVLLGNDGIAKVTDFGLARARAVAAEPAHRTDDTTGGLASHAGFGSPAHASPEQAEGRRLGPRSDLFSFAVTVLEMFTGSRTWVFGAVAGFALSDFRAPGGAAAVGDGVGTGGTTDLPTRSGPLPMPEPIADLLAQCLSLDPAERPASAGDTADRLREVHRQLFGRAYD
ncbi:serine/threonine-protein kinase, partial [Streptomyces sp. NPDC059072]|uniref:serine/threonine-protein kinase n=1 Tax=Streptomyces sp. NPDC059072 TaxID=3346715 RepID=UPI0036836D17